MAKVVVLTQAQRGMGTNPPGSAPNRTSPAEAPASAPYDIVSITGGPT